MLVFDQRNECPLADRRPAVTMGVFDGVHRGHQKILAELGAIAKDFGGPSLAITYSPHPRQALGRAAPPGICSVEKRLELLDAAGLDAVWLLTFTPEFAEKSGMDFAEEFFHRRLNAGAVVLGEAASFGNGRDGTIPALREWAKPWGTRVIGVPPLTVDGSVVSSTAVRLAVQAGNLGLAADYLGRRVSVQGMVVHGQGHGHKLGFPTINLDPFHELRPPPAVYLTKTVMDGVEYHSITNIGRPPTEQEIAAGLRDFLIETHLLDFDQDVYGKSVEIFFYHKTRDVMHFSSLDDLVVQVKHDLDAAREWFARYGDA
ncbi:MAG: riboflavin biosynthesis protein RibF [Planctomycetes bacterium]|nr:riboflavin biosynthesis protein RibF [Planctomycetota bacterium]